jgi:hypothetical protein
MRRRSSRPKHRWRSAVHVQPFPAPHNSLVPRCTDRAARSSRVEMDGIVGQRHETLVASNRTEDPRIDRRRRRSSTARHECSKRTQKPNVVLVQGGQVPEEQLQLPTP